MKKMIQKMLITLMIFILLPFSSCDVLMKSLENASSQTVTGSVTTSEIVAGLKEALKVGTNNAVSTLNIKDAFYKSARFKIPFPNDVKIVEDKLRQYGMGSIIDDFVEKMNRGAEQAVAEAKPIFVNAITSMTIQDAKNILFGADNAATNYFKQKTSGALFNAFKPKVKSVLDNKVKVTQTWNDVLSAYNKIPGVTKVDTDLPKYITDKTIEALFTRIAEEEKNIRENPTARVNAILQKVFGELDNN